MPDYLKVIIPSVLGLITTVIAAFLSARWAIHRALKERWWTRKEQAYSEIIEALHDLLRYSGFMAEQECIGAMIPQPKELEFSVRYSEAYWKVQKMTDIGPFVISEDATQILNTLRNRPKLNFNSD